MIVFTANQWASLTRQERKDSVWLYDSVRFRAAIPPIEPEADVCLRCGQFGSMHPGFYSNDAVCFDCWAEDAEEQSEWEASEWRDSFYDQARPGVF